MNIDTYTSEMAKSVWDKAFFMDKIPGAKCVIDFGCADGSLIFMLAEMFPDMKFYGFDHLPVMIERARTNARPNTYFYNSWGLVTMCDCISHMYKPDEICLNFSSVLHEVFSSSPSGKDSIKYIIEKLNPKYITIRDMYYSGEDHQLRWKTINDIIDKLHIDNEYLDDFELYHGSVATEKGLLHFLMKYQWKDNGWKQELSENYFSWNLADLFNLIDGRYLYSRLFEAYYLLPYYAEKWKDLGILPTIHHTHAQFILRRDD